MLWIPFHSIQMYYETKLIFHAYTSQTFMGKDKTFKHRDKNKIKIEPTVLHSNDIATRERLWVERNLGRRKTLRRKGRNGNALSATVQRRGGGWRERRGISPARLRWRKSRHFRQQRTKEEAGSALLDGSMDCFGGFSVLDGQSNTERSNFN